MRHTTGWLSSVMILALVLTGCASAPPVVSPLDAARQAWLEQAVAAVEPHVEAATGLDVEIRKVRWHGAPHRDGFCGYYGVPSGGRSLGRREVDFWMPPAQGSPGGCLPPPTMTAIHWLVVIGHELAHAAEWQAYGNPGAGQTHGPRFRRVFAAVQGSFAGPGGWYLPVIRQLPPWPSAPHRQAQR